MEQKRNLTSWAKINKLIVATTLSTCVLFVISFFLNQTAEIITKIISISYLIFFILFLILRTKTKKIIEIKPQGKIARKKKFTGSTYGKIFHKRECRFADSIKDKYFTEDDNKEYFQKLGYKACKLCMSKKSDDSNLREKKRI